MPTEYIIGAIGIVVAIVLLIIMAYKSVNVLVYTLVCGIIVAVTNGMNPIAALAGYYAAGYVGYYQGYFLLMLFSVFFAKMMTDSGACEAITVYVMKFINLFKTPMSRAMAMMIALGFVQAILQAGGINPLVSIFVVIGFAIDVCKRMNIPWRLAYLTCWGSSSPIACFIPGSPFSNNLIPAEFFGSKAIAMPVVTLISLFVGILLCILYTYYELRKELPKAEATGEGFLPSGARVVAMYQSTLDAQANKEEKKYNAWHLIRALIPCVLVFVALNAFNLPAWVAMLVGCVGVAIFFCPTYKPKQIPKSFEGSVMPALSVCNSVGALVGFGIIVQYTPAYSALMTLLSGVVPSSDNTFGALWILVGVTCVACGVTASATGGLQAVLQPLAPTFLATGINPGVLHRVCTMTTGIFDSLPHSSAIINGFQVFGVDHKMCYKYVFVETVLITAVMTAVGVILFSLGMQC